MSLQKAIGRMVLCGTVAVSMTAGLSNMAFADRASRCAHDIHKAEVNLDKAVHKHGEHSRQAEEKRHQLEAVRARCQ